MRFPPRNTLTLFATFESIRLARALPKFSSPLLSEREARHTRPPPAHVRHSCLSPASCLHHSLPSRHISVAIISCWSPPLVSGWAMWSAASEQAVHTRRHRGSSGRGVITPSATNCSQTARRLCGPSGPCRVLDQPRIAGPSTTIRWTSGVQAVQSTPADSP